MFLCPRCLNNMPFGQNSPRVKGGHTGSLGNNSLISINKRLIYAPIIRCRRRSSDPHIVNTAYHLRVIHPTPCQLPSSGTVLRRLEEDPERVRSDDACFHEVIGDGEDGTCGGDGAGGKVRGADTQDPINIAKPRGIRGYTDRLVRNR